MAVVVREHMLYEFSPFKFSKTCLMAQQMVYLDEYSMCT